MPISSPSIAALSASRGTSKLPEASSALQVMVPNLKSGLCTVAVIVTSPVPGVHFTGSGPAPNTSARPSESSFGLVCMKSVPVNSFSNFSKPAPLAPLAWTVAAPPGAKGDELTSLSNT